jgi:hypothetical protein
VSVGGFTRFNEWLLPINPKNYAKLTTAVLKRNKEKIAA